MNFFSPAKLNLFFRVLHKRSDGYHEIASIFGAISLGDDLDISLSSSDVITCNDPTIPLGEENLVMKAIHLFRKHSGLSFHAAVQLEKRIPQQAGLGGGSSNAATTLWGLNQLVGTPFSEEELMELGGEIGSDVAFFFSQGCAYCTGRGERVSPLDPFPFPSMVVAKPHAALSTQVVYQETKAERLPPRDVQSVVRSFQEGHPILFNDLEEAAFKIQPQMAVWKDYLITLGFEQVVMTGSGTAFYCLGEVVLSPHKEITFYPVRLLSRKEGEWWHLALGRIELFC